jgi:hypothetical protein
MRRRRRRKKVVEEEDHHQANQMKHLLEDCMRKNYGRYNDILLIEKWRNVFNRIIQDPQ